LTPVEVGQDETYRAVTTELWGYRAVNCKNCIIQNRLFWLIHPCYRETDARTGMNIIAH